MDKEFIDKLLAVLDFYWKSKQGTQGEDLKQFTHWLMVVREQNTLMKKVREEI